MFGQLLAAQTFSLKDFLLNQKDSSIYKPIHDTITYKLKISYTHINSQNELLTYHFGDFKSYIYPASLSKVPYCLLTYYKLNQLKLSSELQLVSQNPHTPAIKYLLGDSLFHQLSIKQHIERCLIMSDNSSPNYLYDFLGYDYIKHNISILGFTQSHINQRFYKTDTLGHKKTFKVVLLNPQNDTVYFKNEELGVLPFQVNTQKVLGTKHINAKNKLVQQPMDFSKDNYLNFKELHALWADICLNKKSKMNTTIGQSFLNEFKKIASTLPKNSFYPNYYSNPDNFRKFIFYGDTSCNIPENIILTNKVGLAYGCISDVSTYYNTLSGTQFTLTIGMYCNKNEIINDGKYEYESVGLPFMGKLGRKFILMNEFLQTYRSKSVKQINNRIVYRFYK
ncbi:MAG: serine hydrolase [Cytophagales bacterium]